MRLPESFIAEMTELWRQYQPDGTLAEFVDAHQAAPASGLRANLLKLNNEELISLMDRPDFAPVAWSSSGFYTPDDLNPGRLTYYHAGLYYIQEPSAMLPAEILDVQPGEKVLDLCAAPGGKSSRLAAMVGRDGLLWANEISGERVKALLRNLELMGVDRSIISQETPERLADRLPEYFDRILVDAPCSGSGMFRRDPSAVGSWEKYGPAACAMIQQEILESADRMLKPGGYMVYSTCSFSLAEDEQMIARFVEKHPDYCICPVSMAEGISPGLNVAPNLHRTVRIWPHRTRGDGHFCALLQKTVSGTVAVSGTNTIATAVSGTPASSGLTIEKAQVIFAQWAESVFSEMGLKKLRAREELAFYRLHQEHLHLVPDITGSLLGLHLVKTGLYLGQFRQTGGRPPKNQKQHKGPVSPAGFVFDPAHALLLTLRAEDLRYALRLPADDPTLLKFLRGETIEWPTTHLPVGEWPAGSFVAICLEDYPLGWAKATSPGQLKNLYPPGWRKLN